MTIADNHNCISDNYGLKSPAYQLQLFLAEVACTQRNPLGEPNHGMFMFAHLSELKVKKPPFLVQPERAAHFIQFYSVGHGLFIEFEMTRSFKLSSLLHWFPFIGRFRAFIGLVLYAHFLPCNPVALYSLSIDHFYSLWIITSELHIFFHPQGN